MTRRVGVPPAGSPISGPAPACELDAESCGGRNLDMATDTVTSLIFTGVLEWTVDAACGGQTDLFFAPAGERPEARVVREAAARSVCADCPVLLECRDWAREHREYGYWGGESEEERAAAGYRVDMPVGRVARYPRGNGTPVEPRITPIA